MGSLATDTFSQPWTPQTRGMPTYQTAGGTPAPYSGGDPRSLQTDRTRGSYFTEINTPGSEPWSMPGYSPAYSADYDPYGFYGGSYLKPNANPQEVDAFIRANYGYFAAFIDNPEVGPILRQAAQERWDEARLYGAITSTNWWQNTDAANRTWQRLVSEDPAEARRLANQTAATIQNRANTLGLNLSSGQISSIATLATQNGWTDAQMVDHMLKQVNWANLEAGDLTALRDDVRALAGDYVINMSEDTARRYAQRIASGEMTMQGVRSALVRQAKARFGWMESQLDQGVTVRDYFRSASDAIANELEVDPDQIDLMNPKWLGMLEVRDKNGQLGPASINDAVMAARRDPMWARTRRASEMTTNVVGMLADTFGLRGL